MAKSDRRNTHWVAGYNKHGHRLWGPVPVEAPNATVAKMYATAALKKIPHGEALNITCTQIVAIYKHRDTPMQRVVKECEQLLR